MDDAKRFFWLSCHDEAKQKSSAMHLHRVRDGAACLELASIAFAAGYSYGGLLLNIPRPGNHNADAPGQFMADDLLIMPTRPGIDERGRKRVPRKNTELERAVLRELTSRVFLTCGRWQVFLGRGLRKKLGGGFEDRAEIDFFQLPWPAYQRVLDDPRKPKRSSEGPTAGYLVFLKALARAAREGGRSRSFTKAIDGDGPDVLVVFGLSGPATLIWTNLLRTRFADVVRRVICGKHSAIVVGELTPGPGDTQRQPSVLPLHPSTLDFIREYKAELILDAVLD